MARNSSPARKGGKQPPFEIVLDEACSIVCDDVPSNCTIRVMQVDGRSPPRLSPASKWVEDYISGSPPGTDGWGPPPGANYGRVIESPISSPPSPMRSRRSIVESLWRNLQENSGGATSSGIHSGGPVEQEVFDLRKPCCRYESQSPSPTPSVTSPSSYSSLSSRQPSPSSPQSAVTDRLLNSNRPQMNFRRTNIDVDGTDLHEMHSNSGSSGSQMSPVQSATTRGGQKWASHSSRPSPPSPARGGRCCGMADYNPSPNRSKTPERDSSGGVSPSRDVSSAPGVSAGATCFFHGSEPCPARAGARCRANRNGQSTCSPGIQGARSCKYHDPLPCPALAGVPCRGEIQKSGASSPPSRPASPSPRDPSSPRSPGSDTWSQSQPEYSSSRPGSSGRTAGVYYPPKTISPPPKSPRSRSPHRMAPHKNKGESPVP